jgi:hypothetical protein
MKVAIAVTLPLLLGLCTALGQTPLVDLNTAVFEGATNDHGAIHCEFKLPARRSNWSSNDWKICTLPEPLRMTGDAIRITVDTKKPRSDVGVFLALGEADGSWYCYPWAASLTQATNSGIAPLRDFTPCEWTSPGTPGGKFFDENGQLDIDQVTRIAIGTVNGEGVGPVEFTLKELSAVASGTKPPPPATIEVSGRFLDINGTQMLPAGLFGGFNLKEMEVDGQKLQRTEVYRLAADRMISGEFTPTPITHTVIRVTGGDRGGPSPRLTNPKWKAEAEAEGQRIGAAAKASGRTAYVEYFNEPYLNWANKNRRSFNPKYFDESQAVEGGPVKILHDETVVPFLHWTKNYDVPPWKWCERADWRRGRDEAGKVYSEFAEPTSWGRKQSSWAPETHPPENVKDGETYTVKIGKKGEEKEVKLTAFTPWQIYDDTQFTYWSAKGLGMFYNEPMLAFGKAFKEAGGDKAVYIAGWGFRPSENQWAAFDLAYKPTIDAGISVIDGVCDHDYGGSPTKASAYYEVVCAYGMTAHKKWLYGYNTECSGNYDPQAFASAGAAGSPELAGARWVAEKILHALDYVPDKARNFAWFGGGNFFHDDGEGLALRALINLRGRLLAVRNDDPQLYAAAAVDGTDPLNPRPEKLGPGKELVLAVFNSAPESRQVELSVTAPKGTTLGTPVVRLLKAESGKPVLVEAAETKLEVGSRDLVVATYPLAGELADVPPVKRTQNFANVILQEVTPAAPIQTTIASKPGASRAWVQFVAERLAEGEATITLNGTTIPLPACVTPVNTSWIRRVPVDPALIKSDNTVIVKVSDPSQAGFLLGSLSLIVEHE